MADPQVKPSDVHSFEALFQNAIDPWNYRTSRFEARKRQDLLRACGSGKVGRGLELACAIGETSRALMSRCLTLVATDGAPTALAEAKRLTPQNMRIDYRAGILPRDLPRGPFDLIVVSEIAYYLPARQLDGLARSLLKAVAPGGTIVVLHHVIPFDDAAQLPAMAQARLCRALEARMIRVHGKRQRRYVAAAFRRKTGPITNGSK
ncbi:methyltransferase domain-containing protein [Tianweitania sp. BSSL-BM11]|uniref:Methyltransferase domain-containing protein n=1 Tax=Tianweitania aestuarii TaxID=2814886 RepID=A0ABS5RYC6_9HYPH|nr:SAM-dependent methyltransferase [Tianweitania aestuarii]MBS9722021.1 methyltransferase domain-containing protein [Tianweitania aestuarii]